MPNIPDKQEQLRIIQHPTHTTSPDIVGTFEPTMPECIDDKRVGRDFDTFCYLKNLKLKYDKSTRSQLLTKRGNIAKTLAIIGGLAFVLSWIFALAKFISVTMEFDIEFFGEALLVTIPTTVVAFGFVVMHPGLPYADDTVNTFYPLTRKERRTLRKLEYVEVDERLARKVNTIMERSVDTSQLRQPYDDYMNLLVFLRTNRNAISRTLYNEYTEELEKRRTRLDKELDYAVAEINAYHSAEEEYQEDHERVAQDIRDDDALRAMPLPPKNE